MLISVPPLRLWKCGCWTWAQCPCKSSKNQRRNISFLTPLWYCLLVVRRKVFVSNCSITHLEPGSAGLSPQPGNWDSSVSSPGDRESTTKALWCSLRQKQAPHEEECSELFLLWLILGLGELTGNSALCAVLLLLTWSDSGRNVRSLSGELH